ncbi:putative G-protein coupled receptor 139 [Tubulanus polymorphus]|uniref:putative G-protein coupled receptor 139 n=1 Tax=Tubulanus polymorphus TaxID=672921 RepID=UPI003DA2460F
MNSSSDIAAIGRPYNSYIILMSTVNESGRTRLLSLVLLPILFASGAFGNTCTLLIAGSQQFRALSYSNYLIMLSVSDMLVCVALEAMPLLHFWLRELGFGGVPLNSAAACAVYEVVFLASFCNSSWLVVAISLERLAVVSFPLSSRLICTKTFARSAVACVTVGCFAVSSGFFFSMRFTVSLGCYTVPGRHDEYMTAVGSLCYFVPQFLIAAANTAIVVLLFARKGPRSTDRKSATATRMTVMLVTVSVVFTATTFPSMIIWLLNMLGVHAVVDERMVQVASRLQALNYCINFYVYLLLGKDMRACFCQNVCKCSTIRQ